MRHVVGVSERCFAIDPADVVITHALGSCLGIAVYDPVVHLAGILHVMLPSSKIDPDKARANPFMFVDTGVPAFFLEAYARGAVKSRLIVKVAGGATHRNVLEGPLAIGKRNWMVLKRLFWQNRILVSAEEVGGSAARTLSIAAATGLVTLTSAGVPRIL